MSYGLEKQISKFDSKMGYFGGPNKALRNPCFKDQIGLICEGRKEPVEREREEQRREGEEEEEDGEAKVWNSDF